MPYLASSLMETCNVTLNCVTVQVSQSENDMPHRAPLVSVTYLYLLICFWFNGSDGFGAG